MKILFLTYQVAGQGGSYMRSISLARQLVRLGHEVTLVASRSTPGMGIRTRSIDGVRQMEMPDLAPRRVRHGGLSPFDVLSRSMWVLLSEPFDVIHAFEHRPAVMLPGLIGQRARGALLISDWADLWGLEGIAAERSVVLRKTLGRLDDYFEARTRLWVDGITVISSALQERVDHLGVRQARRMTLPPGANLDVIKPVDKEIVRRELGLPGSVRIVAFSGYAPYDEPFSSRVLLELLRKDHDLLLVSSGRPWGRLERIMRGERMSERLIQFGSLSLAENGKMLGAADVLLLPYLDKAVNRGRFPNKFGDFLAAGRPIVTHRTGDLGRMVEANAIGVLAPETPAEFADVVLDLLHDLPRCEALGLAARRFAEDMLGWPSLASRVERFYLDVSTADQAGVGGRASGRSKHAG